MNSKKKLMIGVPVAILVAVAISYFSTGNIFSSKKQKTNFGMNMNTDMSMKENEISSQEKEETEKKFRVILKSLRAEADKPFKIAGLEENKEKKEIKEIKKAKEVKTLEVIEEKDNDGKVIAKKEYKDNGKILISTFENGKLISTELANVKDKVPFGDSVVEYENGNKLYFKYENGIRTGKASIVYKNGEKEEFSYKNNKKNGNATYYFQNGDKEEYIYVDDVVNGDARYTYKNGKKEEYKYENGEIK